MATPTLHDAVRFKTPAVCHKSTRPISPILPGTLPPDLHGTCRWRDSAIPGYIDFVEIVPLLKVPGSAAFVGRGPGIDCYFKATVIQNPMNELWTTQIILNRTGQLQEDYTFPPYAINLALPFDTGLLSFVSSGNISTYQSRFAF